MSKGSSQMPREDYYFLMLKVSPEKEIVPVKWSLSNLDDSSAALVIDESNERIYLWLGESTDGITKAVARRKANDISSQGYRLQNIPYPIGRVGGKRLEIVEVNQTDMIKDSKIKEVFGDLKNLFRKKSELLEGGVLARPGIKVPAAMRELGQPIARTPAKFQEVSKAIEERFGRAPEIIAERESMRERYREREFDKVAAIYTLAFIEVLGGKVNIEVSRQGQNKIYRISTPTVKETPHPIEATAPTETPITAEIRTEVEAEPEKKCSYVIEDKKLRILEGNLTQEDIGMVMKKVGELS